MSQVYLRSRIKWIFFVSFLLILSSKPFAAKSDPQQEADVVISQLHQGLPLQMIKRLESISAQFIGKSYLLGALGEGSDARFDQAPPYRTDAFDCETYVTTVLALALAAQSEDFKQCLNKIRYKRGKVDFITRNHFTSLDWNRNNQQQHFIKDISFTIKDKTNRPVAQMASALIDKPSWYQHLSKKAIRLINADEKEQTLRLAELKRAGSLLEKKQAKIPYLPLTALFNGQGQANLFLFTQIPNGSIIEIVRPNWNLREKVGTNLNVSHIGFAFWKKGVLLFRQASSEYGRVIESSLIDYLQKSLKSPTIKGINVQVVVPEHPLGEGCKMQSFNIK